MDDDGHLALQMSEARRKKSCACQVAGGFSSVRSASALLTWATRSATIVRENLVLDSEDILQLAVVALSPAVRAGHGIDELGADADAITGATDTAFEHVAHAEFAPHLPDVR